MPDFVLMSPYAREAVMVGEGKVRMIGFNTVAWGGLHAPSHQMKSLLELLPIRCFINTLCLLLSLPCSMHQSLMTLS